MKRAIIYLRGLIGRANNSSSVSLLWETGAAGWVSLITASREATAAAELGFGVDSFGAEAAYETREND